jgi:hypothetical protein
MSRQPKKELELHPDAWARFERAVDVVAELIGAAENGWSRSFMMPHTAQAPLRCPGVIFQSATLTLQ